MQIETWSVLAKTCLYAAMHIVRNSRSSFGSVTLGEKWSLVSSSQKGELGWTDDIGMSSWQRLNVER